jgi:mannosyltransferase
MPAIPVLEPKASAKSLSLPHRLAACYPWLVVAVLVAAGAVLRFHALGQKSVWIDEGVSIEMARLDWYNFLRILWRHEANMALYTLLLRFWLPFGDGEAWIRTLSVVPALATIPAVYLLGRRLFDARVGLMASFLLVINAFHVRYSQEARSYSWFALLCVLSCIYFLKSVEDPSSRNRKGHVLTSVLAVYAHFFAGFVVVAQWLSLTLLDNREVEPLIKKSWRQFAIAIAPLVIFVASTGVGVLRWIPRPGWISLHITAIYLTGGGGDRLVWLYAAACGLAVIPVVPTLFRFRRMGPDTWRYVLLAIWLLFPITAVFLISQWKPCFLARYFIFTVPALALLAAAGIARLRWRWLMGGALLLFAAWSLTGVYSGYHKDLDTGREDFRAATRYILAHAEPRDAILFHQPIGRVPYEYYRSVTAAAAYPIVIYPAHGDGLTFKDFYAGRPPQPLLASVPSEYGRVWVVFTHNQLNRGPDATTSFISALYGNQYPISMRQEFQEIEVRLYCRNSVGIEASCSADVGGLSGQ